ncbi:helix-hairpin-helix domain-containing protein [uncultured Aquimarina sp.]|uniref:helix-hairpin-helix domain-containing protein n=1 Tax=uncultured Aquimarina sp. TaxID=575652 RepID=UPI00263A33E9|nr:helix-hairpin-helix domain-containing protein [uncultured Aquimarina sp.]
MKVLQYDNGIKELKMLPRVGDKAASCLWRIGIHKIDDLKYRSPEKLYTLYNKLIGKQTNRALLYIFRCAVYVTETPKELQEKEKLDWFYWNDKKNKNCIEDLKKLKYHEQRS